MHRFDRPDMIINRLIHEMDKCSTLELAKRSGVSEGAIRNIKANKAFPRLDTFLRLIEVLEIPVNDILELDDQVAMNAENTIADRIAFLSDEFGGNLAFSKDIMASESVVRKWRKGESYPTYPFIKAILVATKCNIDWLINGEGEPFDNVPLAPMQPIKNVRTELLNMIEMQALSENGVSFSVLVNTAAIESVEQVPEHIGTCKEGVCNVTVKGADGSRKMYTISQSFNEFKDKLIKSMRNLGLS